ncbi:MAG: aminoacyl-tRNA hydrolase [Firmicutes bacterium]|nr:aminoacyl-tRNA hydrolase [Bacillota bacterium]
MYVIVGLGNPGLKYAKTRHNMGFMAIDRLAEIIGAKVNKLEFKSKVGDGNIAGHKVVLVKPQTYMNLSGHAVREIMDFYKVDHDHLIVIYDDLDIDTGSIRIRAKGSAGTHNGMKSIVGQLGYDDFPRIRVGIGNERQKERQGDTIGFVIGKVAKEDKKVLQDSIDRAAKSAISIIEEGVDRAMNRYNGNN